MKIGDEIIVDYPAQSRVEYYSGQGKIVNIRVWDDGRNMIAVNFAGKGTAWFHDKLLKERC